MRQGTSYIGTSGWSYPHWVGPFYPPDLPAREHLDHYARRLRAVEIAHSFYRLPEATTLARWRDTVDADFVFAVKASRYLTHMKKLGDCWESLRLFLDRVSVLGGNLGPVLFQLPGGWHADVDRLEEFLADQPAGGRYAFEFRDRDWMPEEVFALLHRHDAALCVYDFAGWRSPRRATASWAYVRYHGPRETPYVGRYHGNALRSRAVDLTRWRDEGRDVYCFFDDDEDGHAVHDALRFRRWVEG